MSNELFVHWYRQLFGDIVPRPDVEEIAINAVGSDDAATIVWVRFRSEMYAEPYVFPKSRAVNLELFVAMAANHGNQYYGPKAPMVYAVMPDGARFVAAHGAVTPYQLHDTRGLALCIRGNAPDADLASVKFPLVPANDQIISPDRIPFVPVPEILTLGSEMRAAGKGVLLIGDKGTGKTNAVKNLLTQLDPKWRCVVIEDQREVPHILPNTLFLTAPRNSHDIGLRIEQILEMSARTPAQVLVLGEISSAIAARMERIAQQGFRAVITTLHGMDLPRGVVRLYQEIAFGSGATGTPAMDAGSFRDFMVQRFGALVHLTEDPGTGKKTISAIEKPENVLSRVRLPTEAARSAS